MEMLISGLLAATMIYVWQRLLVLEAVRLLDLQRHRTQYKQDDQIVTQKQVAEFIERYK